MVVEGVLIDKHRRDIDSINMNPHQRNTSHGFGQRELANDDLTWVEIGRWPDASLVACWRGSDLCSPLKSLF